MKFTILLTLCASLCASQAASLVYDVLTHSVAGGTISGSNADWDGSSSVTYTLTDSDVSFDVTFTVGGTATSFQNTTQIGANGGTTSGFDVGETASYTFSNVSSLNSAFNVTNLDLTGVTRNSAPSLSVILSGGQLTSTFGGARFDELTFGYDLAPVPEPSSAALLGLGGLALISRRKR